MEKNKVRIAGIVKESIVDGPGIRLTVFTQGCKHNCRGCHNPQTHSFDGGSETDLDKILVMIKKNPLLDGVTFSGGEPFEQAEVLSLLAKEVKKIGLHTMTYTGYTWEQINEGFDINIGWRELLLNTDILVDGPFILEQKNLMLKFRGSENQRVIDVAASIKENKVILCF